ncbi:MAG: hypothetical protein ACOYOP_11220 [Microthrixaceae bacterium]
MSPVHRILVALRHRRAAARSQQGYTLLFVLGVMGLTFLTTGALLGLALTSSLVAERQATGAERNRAADGALEATVARIARTTAGSPCAAVPSSGGTVAMGPGDVTVECTYGTSASPPDQPIGVGPVDLLGADPDQPSASRAGLYHRSAVGPLPFDSDVVVRRNADVAGTAAGPAVTATGQYEQGQPGPGATGTSCGPLGTTGTNQVKDRDDSPVCGKSFPATTLSEADPLANYTTQDPPALPGCPASQPKVLRFAAGPYRADQVKTLNSLLRTCNDATFLFESGVYEFDANDPSATDVDARTGLVIDNPTVSVVFGRPSGWDPAVAIAPSGAFPQACDPNVAGASIQLSGRTALRHTAGRVAICPARGVSGAPLPAVVQVPTATNLPRPTLVASDFGVTGDPNDSPTALVVDNGGSARARLPYCPGALSTVCYRSKSFTLQWGNLPPGNISDARLLLTTRETPRAHVADRGVNVAFRDAAGAVIASCNNVQVGRTNQMTSTIDLAACAPSLVGRPATVLENSRMQVTYNYSWSCIWFVDCYPVPSSGEVIDLYLANARLEVNSAASPGLATGTSAASSSTDGASVFGSAANVLANDGAFSNANQPNDCALNGLFPTLKCSKDTMTKVQSSPDVWRGPTRSVTVRNLQFGAGDPLGDTSRALPLNSLYAVVANAPNGAGIGSYVSDPIDETQVTASLRLPNGANCQITLPGFAVAPGITRLNLLRNSCAGINSRDVVGADLTLSYRSGCAWNGQFRYPVVDGKCETLTVPPVQFLALQASTSTVLTSPPRSLVTVDVNGATSGRVAEFHAFGGARLPSTTLDLNWAGAARQATDIVDTPLFGGQVVLNALRSAGAGTPGTVCCTPPGDAVTLTAKMGGSVVGRAVVKVDASVAPTASTGRPVQVLDWRLGSS